MKLTNLGLFPKEFRSTAISYNTVYFVTGLLRLRLIEIELDDRLMEIGDVLAHRRHLAGICTYLESTDSRMLALTSGQQML